MPLNAGQLGGEPIPGKLEWADDVLHFMYRPGDITLEMIEQANRVRDDKASKENIPFLAAYLVSVLDSWDLYERDNVTLVAITVERIKRLNAPFLSALMQKTMEDSEMGEASAQGNSGPSSLRDSKGQARRKRAS